MPLGECSLKTKKSVVFICTSLSLFGTLCVRRISSLLLPLLLFVPLFEKVSCSFGGGVAYAEDRVVLLGINVPCSNCEVRGGNPCQLVFRAEKRQLSCEQALREILEQNAHGANVSKDDLRRLVFIENTEQELAAVALRLLLQTGETRDQTVGDLGTLVEKKPELILKVMKEQGFPNEGLLALSHLPRRKESELIRGYAIGLDSSRSPLELVEELPGVDVENDKEDVALYAQAMKEIHPEWEGDFLALGKILSECESSRDQEFEEKCLKTLPPEKLANDSRYLLRLKTNLLLRRLSSPEIEPSKKLQWFTLMDCGRYRTPETLKQLRVLLTLMLKQPFAKQQEFLESDREPFLKNCSAHDKELASLAALLYVKYASGIWELGGKRESTKALFTSYELFPEFLEARTSFAGSVALELPREEKWYQDAWGKLPEKARQELTWSPNNTTELILAVVGASSVLLLILMVAYFSFRKPKEEEEDDVDEERPHISLESAEELRVLLEFFELKPPIKPHDLTRRYRQKAKILHPDTVSGNSKEFTELGNKYQRAKELLFQFGSRNPPSESSAEEN